MPPSAKRTYRNKRASQRASVATPSPSPEPHDEDEDSGGGEASPVRPAKRRKRSSTSHEPADEVAQVSDDDQLLSQITQQLLGAPIQAARDHANTIHEKNRGGVKAYAKIAARDWTFYVNKLDVNIGRHPEAPSSMRTPTAQVDPESQNYVHIDLGPGKLVSRNHASINFDSKQETWIFSVRGRNGAKVNTEPLRLNQQHKLTSGDVIEIANVEMMFVLPIELTPLIVHPTFLDRSNVTPSDRLIRASPTRAQDVPQTAAPAVTPTRDSVTPATPSTRRQRRTQLYNDVSETRTPGSLSTPAIMIGTNNLDLSQEENQHIKPQFSYAQMITQAISEAPGERLTLNGIYQCIMDKYSYYRYQPPSGWQNSIRHNLSLNKSFGKIARSVDEPGKGMKWHIVPDQRDEMMKNAYRSGRGGHRGSSAPSSPSGLNYITQGPRDMVLQESPLKSRMKSTHQDSPSRSPLPDLQSTPFRPNDRLRRRAEHPSSNDSPQTQTKKGRTEGRSFSGLPGPPQSPTLTSSFLQDDGPNSLVTPAQPRIQPKLAPPSTMQQPSHFIQYSSPAPFWKYAETGSTPLKPPATSESSPSKLTQSSSPPRSRRKSSPSSPSRGGKIAEHDAHELTKADEDARGGFDLTKGFKSIGSYHSHVNGQRFPMTGGLRGR